MPNVIVGYSEHQGYRLTELPLKALDELAERYPLRLDDQYAPDYEALLITVAVHAELKRRVTGGKQEQRIPTLRELAVEIVTRGYQQASKHHHPDGKGHHEAQLRLTQARDELHSACNNLAENDNNEGITIIPPPGTPRPRVRTPPSEGITDDDVPF